MRRRYLVVALVVVGVVVIVVIVVVVVVVSSRYLTLVVVVSSRRLVVVVVSRQVGGWWTTWRGRSRPRCCVGAGAAASSGHHWVSGRQTMGTAGLASQPSPFVPAAYSSVIPSYLAPASQRGTIGRAQRQAAQSTLPNHTSGPTLQAPQACSVRNGPEAA